MSSILPIIHPFQDKPPRWADEAHTQCGCNHCRHWAPLLQSIEAQLDERGKALLREFTDYHGNIELDYSVAEAKLAGDWPGWAAMKNFRPNPRP